MDHNESVKLQAVEKYILGELSPLLRGQFEEHYFDCADCALNLRAGVAFAAASRDYFVVRPAPVAVVSEPRPGWFAWLRPIAVPAFAALVLFVAYQNLVMIPQLRHSGREASAEAVAVPSFSLIDASVHGSAGKRVEIKQGQGFELFIDVTAKPRDPNSAFVATIETPNGKRIAPLRISQEIAQSTVTYRAPAGLAEGNYKIVILDQVGPDSTPTQELPFSIAFIK